MRKCFNLALAGTLAVVIVVATTLVASASGYSIGDASGQLYVQAYTRFARPGFTLNMTGDTSSCQQSQHINETLWLFTKSSQPVPQGGNAPYSWLEAGIMGGINLGNPQYAGCDIGYYYENHPNGNTGWVRRIPMGISNSTNNYWIRFVNTSVGSPGAYVIIDGNEYDHFTDQTCCSGRIDVGLELSANSTAGWSASTTDDTPLAWYDQNWNVSYWRGCTVAGFPNNCSYQSPGFTGWWPNVWNDYRNSLP